MDQFEVITQIIKQRRSIRSFGPRALDIELVQAIIHTASHAPSNNNRQGWRFYLIPEADMRKDIQQAVLERLAEMETSSRTIADLMPAYQQNFLHFTNAAVVIACCFVKPNQFQFKLFPVDEENGHFSGELISLSLVIQNILLISESLNIGTLVMTAPLIAARDIKRILNIPPKYTIGAFVCMGYYDRKPEPPPHKTMAEIMEVVSKQR